MLKQLDDMDVVVKNNKENISSLNTTTENLSEEEKEADKELSDVLEKQFEDTNLSIVSVLDELDANQEISFDEVNAKIASANTNILSLINNLNNAETKSYNNLLERINTTNKNIETLIAALSKKEDM